MSGISTVAGAEAMSAVDAAQSGTASALMGTLMFVFGGIAAPLAGLGGETMLENEPLRWPSATCWRCCWASANRATHANLLLR